MIKYPNMKKTSTQKTNYTNIRGMNLEKDLNDSNVYYVESGKAVIYKKPTPINVVRVNYEKRSSAKIIEAYYQQASTTDYTGVYKGKAIDFEAKETKSTKEFRLDLIHPHQIQHLKRVLKQGAVAFIVVRFTALNETYILDAQVVVNYYENKEYKAIPISVFYELGKRIVESYTPRLKYLDAIDELYFKEGNNEEK